MADELKEVEDVEVKPVVKTNPVTAVLIGIILGAGGTVGVDVATADAQKDAIVAEYVKGVAVEYADKTSGDSVKIVSGKKSIVPAEVDFKPNIIIDSTMIFEMIITDVVSGKVWKKGTIRATDSTGRLHAFMRIQPCSADILNADTIPDIKE